MGCSEAKDPSAKLPIMICIFEPENTAQKDYCIKLQQNFKHSKSIRYEIKSTPNSTFSITMKINGKEHQIQNYFNESEFQNTLQKMYDLLDKEDEQNPDPNAKNNNNPNPSPQTDPNANKN